MTTTYDLRAAPVTRESCYVKIKDPTLPHQMNINWDRDRGKNMTRFVALSCNCGAVLCSLRPEEPGTIDHIARCYAEHVESLL